MNKIGNRLVKNRITLSPLARLMARKGLSTRSTRRILTTEIAPELFLKNGGTNGKPNDSRPQAEMENYA